MNGATRLILGYAIPLFAILTWLSSAALSYAGTPVPTYGTYFGGTGDTNAAVAVAVDPAGNVIVAGYTTSQTLPGTATVFQPSKATGLPDNQDVFVAKFDPTGHTLLWATFLGGDGDDVPSAVAVDFLGNIYVAGTTQSSNFPASTSVFCFPSAGQLTAFGQACSTELAANAAGGFLSKISPDGERLLYSVGFGDMAHGAMMPTALAVDNQGKAYVGAVGPGASEGLFLLCLNPSGSGLVYGSYVGSGGITFPATIAALMLDSEQNCYVVGSATMNVPTTPNALQTSNSNSGLAADLGNGFLLEVPPSGSSILYGTWFGPRYYATTITSVALDSDGSLLFAGETDATTFPVTSGAYLSAPSGGFIARFTPGSNSLSALSYLPFPREQGCGGGAFPGDCFVNVGMALVNQTHTVHLLFRANVSGAPGEILELSLPTLGGASAIPSYTLNSQTGEFNSQRFALASPSTLWVVGGCTLCPLGDLISNDAFQSSPLGTSSAVLIQLTDISPSISFVGSSATGTSPFAAGQLVSIYGSQLGPSAGSGLQLGPAGVVTTSSGGTQVLFGGTAAPILYAGSNQVNAVIPCELAGESSTQMVVEYMGAQSPAVTVPLGPAAPGIFTADGSGKGQAAALNQDNSFNGPSNPAARGSIVTFYATGVGPTSPCGGRASLPKQFPDDSIASRGRRRQ